MATTFDELIEELARQQTPQADQYLAQFAEPQPAPTTAPMPMPVRQPAPEPEPPMPERRDVGPTTAESIGLAVSSLGEGFKGLANRLGNRPQQSSRHAAFRQAVAQDVAGRQRQANQEYSDSMQQRAQAVAKALQQKKMAAEQAVRDPNSPESERAWRVVNSMRTEAGLAPLDESQRGSFVAADAKTWLANAPQAMASQLQRQQAMEGDVRKQATDAASARAQLDVLREMNVPLNGVDTSDPAAVKLAYDTAMKREGWSEAEKRSRIEAAAQRQQQQQVHTPVRSAIEGVKDSDYYASHPQEAYAKANELQMAMADPTFHQSSDSERVVSGISPVVEMLKGRSRTVDGWKQVEGRPPPSEEEWKEAMRLSDGAEKIRKGMEYMLKKAPSGLGEWIQAQGGLAAQILADPDAIESNPELRRMVKSAQDLEDFKAAASGIALALKDFESMGALDKGTQDISKELSGDPTGIITMITGNSGRAVQEALGRVLAAVPGAMKNRGFERPSEGKTGGQEPQQQSPEGGVTPKQQKAQQILQKFGNSPELTPEKRARLEAIVRGEG